ncbi:hypothetical protein [Crenothrix sp.]|uniref:hypothetical protein n=1 Tax=Crenothrix sp. TaxID=3100433 RepID=UPI00374D2949
MKLIQVLSYSLATVVFCASGSAAAAIYGGATCHNYEGRDAGTFEFYGHGITNGSPSLSKQVICPVTKQARDYKGLSVRVNLDSPGAKTVACTLYGYNANGVGIGFKAVKNQKKGKESLTIRVPSSTPRSYFSLVCSLPSKERSEIYSIESLN